MEDEKDVRHGCPLSAGQSAFAPLTGPVAGQRCRAYGEDGSLVAVITYDSRADIWRPEKVFAPSEKERGQTEERPAGPNLRIRP